MCLNSLRIALTDPFKGAFIDLLKEPLFFKGGFKDPFKEALTDLLKEPLFFQGARADPVKGAQLGTLFLLSFVS